MAKFDRNLVEERKKKLDVELLRAGPIHESPMRKERATSLLPGAKSVVVMGKEIFGEVLALLRLSKGAGEAEAGELLGPRGMGLIFHLLDTDKRSLSGLI